MLFNNLTGFNVPRPNIMNDISEDNEVAGTVNKIIKEIDHSSSTKDISSGGLAKPKPPES